MSIFSQRLVIARKNKNFTQKYVAELLSISPTRLNYWEKGKREPDVEMIKQLSSVLSVTADYLIGLTDNPERTHTTASTLQNPNLTTDENELLTDYRSLNADGKEKSREYTSDLTTIEKYTSAQDLP